MKTTEYSIKISPQRQATFPRKMLDQLNLKPGSLITIKVAEDGGVTASGKLPIEKYFGTIPDGTWGEPGEDAAVYIRRMRNEDWEHRQRKLGLPR